MRLRVIRTPHDELDETADGVVPFGGENGTPLEHWSEGVVVMLGNECAPDQVVVFEAGETHFFDSDGSFTPRVEDWSDHVVRVVLDKEIGK